MHRLETQLATNWNPSLPLTTSVTYGRYARQPELGYDHRREGLLTLSEVNVTPRWSVGGSLLFDLDRYLTFRDTFIGGLHQLHRRARRRGAGVAADARSIAGRATTPPISTGLNLQYMDECTTFGISYSASPREIALSNGEKERVQTVLVRLELRTLGEANVKQNIGPVTVGE